MKMHIIVNKVETEITQNQPYIYSQLTMLLFNKYVTKTSNKKLLVKVQPNYYTLIFTDTNDTKIIFEEVPVNAGYFNEALMLQSIQN